MNDLFEVPKKAYINALNTTDKKFIIAEDFEIQVLLEWIKLHELNLWYFDEDTYITFNVTDYSITFYFDVIDADTLAFMCIDCTDDRLNQIVLLEYFRENNKHLNFV
jgi:hypothetical protein